MTSQNGLHPQSRISNQTTRKFQQNMTKQDYNQLLSSWISFKESMTKNISEDVSKTKVPSDSSQNQKSIDNSHLCKVCCCELVDGQECQTCGMKCCLQCLLKERVMISKNDKDWSEITSIKQDNKEPALTCQNCDKKYLKSLIEFQDQKTFEIQQKKLQQLQQFFYQQSFVSNLSKSPQPSIKNQNTILALTQQNNELKTEISDLHSKISWGSKTKEKLIMKLNKKRKTKNSFSSLRTVSHDIEPPKPYEDESKLNSDNVNHNTESAMFSVIEDETVIVHKRKCFGCFIM